ncbi:MAG: hypothetical protein ACRDSF_01740 [Pseudonocardiaceae bacterium]
MRVAHLSASPAVQPWRVVVEVDSAPHQVIGEVLDAAPFPLAVAGLRRAGRCSPHRIRKISGATKPLMKE